MFGSLFGPSKEDIWRQLVAQIGGEFTGASVRGRSGEWEIVLDAFTTSFGQSTTHYTRMRAAFIKKDGLSFKIYREGVFSKIGKMLGMQDIQIGDDFFDREFMIKGNNEDKIRELLADEKLKSLIQVQPEICFEIRDDGGTLDAHFVDEVNHLHFYRVGVVKNIYFLKLLFEMFVVTLERLVHIGSAYEEDPRIR